MVSDDSVSRPSADDLERYARGEDVDPLLREVIEDSDEYRRAVDELRANNDILAEIGGARRSDPASTLSGAGAVTGYRVGEEISRGGQGIVYKATQERTNRTVALKVLREGAFATSRQRWRFEREIELVASLRHPNIVVVHDSGLTADERLFFAMEFVDGETLTEFAEAQRLGTRDRLAIMAKIARAVHHAHQRGVIHRDLKPANILVTEDREPKILDFGVAVATERDVATTTQQTDVGQLIGTVPYMSPEQVGGLAEDIDTRSDVYALGVLAYQLLAGRLPYELGQKVIHEAARIIQEDDPVPLSSVDRVFRGDVETIIGKALQKERRQRYQSASEFADDIERYLCGEAILAHPPSATYQLIKLAKKHRVAFGAFGGVFAALVIAVAGISFFAVAATDARDAANLAQIDAEQAAAAEREQRELAEERLDIVTKAQREAELARDEALAVFGFFEDTLVAVDPQRDGAQVTVRALLDRMSGTVESDFGGEPTVEAKVREVIGRTYHRLTEATLALEHLEAALALRRIHLEPGHVDVARTLWFVGDALVALDRFEEAESAYREAIALRERVAGEADEVGLTVGNALGLLLIRQQRFDDAREHLTRVRDLWQQQHGVTSGGALEAMQQLVDLNMRQGNTVDAEAVMADLVRAAAAAHGNDDPYTLPLRANHAWLLRVLGRYDEADRTLRDVLAITLARQGASDPDTLTYRNLLARNYRDWGRFDDAEAEYLEVLERLRERHEDEHEDVLRSRQRLARLYIEQRRFDAAQALLSEVLRARRVKYPEPNRLKVVSLRELADVESARLDFGAALVLLDEAIAESAAVEPQGHRNTIHLMLARAIVLRELGDDRAVRAAMSAVTAFRDVHGAADNVETAFALHALANVLLARGDDIAARAALAEVEAMELDPSAAAAQLDDAAHHLRGLLDRVAGDHDAALASFDLVAVPGPQTLAARAVSLMALGRSDDARAALTEAVAAGGDRRISALIADRLRGDRLEGQFVDSAELIDP